MLKDHAPNAACLPKNKSPARQPQEFVFWISRLMTTRHYGIGVGKIVASGDGETETSGETAGKGEKPGGNGLPTFRKASWSCFIKLSIKDRSRKTSSF